MAEKSILTVSFPLNSLILLSLLFKIFLLQISHPLPSLSCSFLSSQWSSKCKCRINVPEMETSHSFEAWGSHDVVSMNHKVTWCSVTETWVTWCTVSLKHGDHILYSITVAWGSHIVQCHWHSVVLLLSVSLSPFFSTYLLSLLLYPQVGHYHHHQHITRNVPHSPVIVVLLHSVHIFLIVLI